ALVPVTDARAIATLTRAFALLLRSGGRPVAVPLSDAAAMAFPRHACIPGGVTWLAVGIDLEYRASYVLQSAIGSDPALTHEAARERALSRLCRDMRHGGLSHGRSNGEGMMEVKHPACAIPKPWPVC